MRNLVLISLLLGLAGCQSIKTITGPDGTPHKLITCGGMEKCYKDARTACDGNYKIVNTSYNVTSTNPPAPSYLESIHLLVKCDPTADAVPAPSQAN